MNNANNNICKPISLCIERLESLILKPSDSFLSSNVAIVSIKKLYSTIDLVKVSDICIHQNQNFASKSLIRSNYNSTTNCDETTYGNFNYISCEGTYHYHGTLYEESGIFEQTIENSQGCDSIVTLNLQLGLHMNANVMQVGNMLLAQESGFYYQWVDCDNDYSPIEGATEQSFIPETSGNYALYIATDDCSYSSNCFSVNIESCVTTYHSENVTTCDEVYSYNGITYDTSGIYEQTLTNFAGCDSIITITLNVHHIDFDLTQSGGTVSANENFEFQLLTDFSFFYQWLECDNDNAPIEGADENFFTPIESGNYAVQISNPFCSTILGCEYVQVGNCNSTYSSIDLVGCTNNYTFNEITYDSEGVHTQILTNTAGCDSIITIHITLLDLSTTLTNNNNTLSAISEGQEYQWVDCDNSNAPIDGATQQSFSPQESGNYAVEIYANGCSVISECLQVTIISCTNTTSSLEVQTCQTNYNLNGTTYNESGTYVQTTLNTAGCDSTITLNLNLQSVNSTVTLNGTTLIAQQTGAIYQWIDCDNSNDPILGATSQDYSPAISGNYAVVISIEECSATSECQSVTITSVNEASENLIRIYPNPSTGIVYVNGVDKSCYFSISDITGKTIINDQRVESLSNEINLSSLGSGIYFIIIKNNEIEAIQTKRLRINK